MKAVIINHSDSRGGASVVSLRLLRALRNIGVDASMLVVHGDTGDPDVHRAASNWSHRLRFLAEHARIFMANGASRSNLFAVSIASDGLPLSRHPLVRQADAVLLGWVNQGMLSLEEIGRMAAMGKRIVWTMHDMWNATGICHHAGECTRYVLEPGCGMCPLLNGHGSVHDISRRTWKRKKHLYEHADIRFVAVSSWLTKKCAESSLLAHSRVTVIPNAFPIDDFYTLPRVEKLTINNIDIPADKKIIVMGAARLDDPVKGLAYAIDALNGVHDIGRTDVHAVFYGTIRQPEAMERLRMPHTMLGAVSSDVLPELYAHATVVLSSSLYETLPGTLIEGQAAGCTPVCFGRGGQPDIVENGVTGYIARYLDADDMAQCIVSALDAPFDRRMLHDGVRARFAADVVARKYLELIEQ